MKGLHGEALEGGKSVSHQGFIEVEDRTGDEHPGGQIRLFEVRSAERLRLAEEAAAASAGAARYRPSECAQSLLQSLQIRLLGMTPGGAAEEPRQPLAVRSILLAACEPPAACAHSRNCSSFKVARACNGVFVDERRTAQATRSGTSKTLINGGGQVRFQNV